MSSQPSRSAPFPRRPRRHYPRSKSGCLTCRVRRKKCDEARPLCAACSQNHRDCVWPSSSVESQVLSTRPPIRSGEALEFERPSTTTLDCNEECPITPEASGHGLSPVLSSTQSHLAPSASQPKQCPVQSDRPRPRPNSSGAEYEAGSPVAPLHHALSHSKLAQLSDGSQLILSYYVACTAPMLAAMPSQNTNPFLQCILPLAYTDDSVMNVVLCLGGAHLCHDDSVAPSLALETWSYYSEVISGLRHSLSRTLPPDRNESLRLLLISLFLCLFEASHPRLVFNSLNGSSLTGRLERLRGSEWHILYTSSSMPSVDSIPVHRLTQSLQRRQSPSLGFLG